MAKLLSSGLRAAPCNRCNPDCFLALNGRADGRACPRRLGTVKAARVAAGNRTIEVANARITGGAAGAYGGNECPLQEVTSMLSLK
jgi:hypothetical protein